MNIIEFFGLIINFITELVIGLTKTMFSASNSVDSVKESIIAAIIRVPVIVISIISAIILGIRLIIKIFKYIKDL